MPVPFGGSNRQLCYLIRWRKRKQITGCVNAYVSIMLPTSQCRTTHCLLAVKQMPCCMLRSGTCKVYLCLSTDEGM